MGEPVTRTVHVVAFEQPGSAGGFDWRETEAEAIDVEREVSAWAPVKSGECALARFTAEVEGGMTRDEITADLDRRLFSEGEFDSLLWPNGYRLAERTNAQRAERAYRAVLCYIGSDDLDIETGIQDFLCDLRHLCDESGYDVATLASLAVRHHRAEVSGEDRDF